MASISRDKNGTKRILFVDASKKRHTIRLGKVSVKAAESFKVRIESLISAQRTGSPIDAQQPIGSQRSLTRFTSVWSVQDWSWLE